MTRTIRPGRTPRVALATAAAVADLDDDERLLARRLRDAGVDATPAVWDDSRVRWDDYDLVVVRSTWDYPPRHKEFLDWAEDVARRTALANPPQILRWSSDKVYLSELAAHGVPVVPTTFVVPGEHVHDETLAGAHVVKPSVSAGSRDTFRLGDGSVEASRGRIDAILATGRTVMVQPFVHSVDSHGETALVYLDGEYSHSIRKAAILREGSGPVEGLFAAEEIATRQPSPAERAVADRALAVVPHVAEPPLYARVDLLPGDDGPVVLELEMVEPSLFLQYGDGALDRLCRAIWRRVDKSV